MNTSAHTSLESLADIADKRLTGATLETAMAHVSVCSSCSETLRRLQRLIHMMKSDNAKVAPHDVLRSALEIFSSIQLEVRRIVAILTFDSRHARRTFGIRSLHTASRQMLYSAEETDVDLRITVQNEECILAGQVIRQHCAGGVVHISGAAGSAEASLNDLCEFTLEAIPLGNYLLRIRMQDLEIEIPELELTR
jgi:hypothetical protein